MKNSDLQELKPVYIHNSDYKVEDEINIIDLTMVLVRRKVIILVTFLVFIASGLAIALLTPREYTFSTTVEVGSQVINGEIKPFEPPQTLLAKLQYNYVPQALTEHNESNLDEKKKYQVEVSIPDGSNILLLQIRGPESQSNTIKKLLQAISYKAIQDHNKILDTLRSDLNVRLKNTINYRKTLKSSNHESSNHELERANTQSIIESLKSQIANLHETREIIQPIRSVEPTGRGRFFIVLISILVGIFSGIFAAFSTEFSSKIKQEIAKGKA